MIKKTYLHFGKNLEITFIFVSLFKEYVLFRFLVFLPDFIFISYLLQEAECYAVSGQARNVSYLCLIAY